MSFTQEIVIPCELLRKTTVEIVESCGWVGRSDSGAGIVVGGRERRGSHLRDISHYRL